MMFPNFSWLLVEFQNFLTNIINILTFSDLYFFMMNPDNQSNGDSKEDTLKTMFKKVDAPISTCPRIPFKHQTSHVFIMTFELSQIQSFWYQY